jgi:hypothetical protein
MLQIQMAAGILSSLVAKKYPQLLNTASPIPDNSVGLSWSNCRDEIITGLPQTSSTKRKKNLDRFFVNCNWVDTQWQQYGTH